MTASKPMWTKGDEPTINITVYDRDDGTVVDLTGATVTLIYWFDNKAASTVTGTLVVAASGTAKYVFGDASTPNGLPDTGLMSWQWRVTDTAGAVFNSDQIFSQEVRQRRVA